MDRTRPLLPGEPAPWFVCRSSSNPDYHFSTVAGRYVVLTFFRSVGGATDAAVLRGILAGRARFDDEHAAFFGVCADPGDEALGRVAQALPGIRYFWDFDGKVRARFGLDAGAGWTFVLDPRLRVIAVLPFGDHPDRHVERLFAFLDALPAIGAPAAAAAQAPVLVVPYVFEPELCRLLAEHYERMGGKISGFMREEDGRTVGRYDDDVKRRRDCEIEDGALRKACMARVHDRLKPEIEKAYQFRATRIERHIVSCYDAADRGHFRAHRDNTTRGTAHRRFAVSLFLNSGQYEGGFLRFPEFGPHLYGAPTGGAVVFSCSLLHEATAVTRGKRYMYLPFLYDDEAARLRDANLAFIGEKQDGAMADRSDSDQEVVANRRM